jgi:hypothetical protein
VCTIAAERTQTSSEFSRVVSKKVPGHKEALAKVNYKNDKRKRKGSQGFFERSYSVPTPRLIVITLIALSYLL